jgi:hypothetical protein
LEDIAARSLTRRSEGNHGISLLDELANAGGAR